MLTNAPWLNYNPLDILGFAVKGAQLGLERGGQATQAAEAAGRLGLGYAQMAAEGNRAAAANALERERMNLGNALRLAELDKTEAWHNAEIGERRNATDAISQYRDGVLQSRAIRDGLAEARLGAVPEPEVKEYTLPDGRVIPYLIDKKTGKPTWAPSGSMSPLKTGAITQEGHAQLAYLTRSLSDIRKKYNDPAMADYLKQQDPQGYAVDQAKMKELDDQIRAIAFKSATDALTPPPDQMAPSGYIPTSGDPRMFKPAPYAVPSGLPSGGADALRASRLPDATDPLGLFQE